MLGGPIGDFASVEQKNKKKQADHRLTGGPILLTTFFLPPPSTPLVKQLHSLDKGIGIFSRRYGITHALVDAVALAKLA